jgi:hypothetical protein
MSVAFMWKNTAGSCKFNDHKCNRHLENRCLLAAVAEKVESFNSDVTTVFTKRGFTDLL